MDIAALIVSVVAIVISVVTWKLTERYTTYASLDDLTLELLKIGIDHPGFRNCRRTSNYKGAFTGPELEAYECYAAIAWDICETVYDRCHRNRWLRKIWEPQIADENRLHRAWFDEPGNGDTYEPDFARFVRKNFPACKASVD